MTKFVCSFSDSVHVHSRHVSAYGSVVREQLGNQLFWPWTQCTRLFYRSWFSAFRCSDSLCLSHTMPGYISIVTVVRWCFARHKQHGKTRTECYFRKYFTKNVYRNDTISETVNDSDSDGGNFSELSDSDTSKVHSPFSSSSSSSEEEEIIQPEPDRGRKKILRVLYKRTDTDFELGWKEKIQMVQ